mmetsp:Transcript_14739/g.38931  ORF Transcript_14739/g.38931 Transcript_14739/m.38931 type:complete len:203 (+) Transcript_14739:3222-3830(+)
MRQVLQGTQVDALVVAELARRHVSVVLDNLTDVLRGHLFLLLLNHTELALLTVPLGVQGLPLTGLLVEELFLGLLRLPVRCPVVRVLRHPGPHGQPRRRSHVHLRLMMLLVRSRHARRKDERVHSEAVLPLLALVEVEHLGMKKLVFCSTKKTRTLMLARPQALNFRSPRSSSLLRPPLGRDTWDTNDRQQYCSLFAESTLC